MKQQIDKTNSALHHRNKLLYKIYSNRKCKVVISFDNITVFLIK